MEEPEKHIKRQEYFDKIQELVNSGKLPKSYRTAVQWALAFVDAPKDEAAHATYEKYKLSIPNIPDSLRAEMDRHILNNLVSEKKLSGIARDNLLRELHTGKLRHGETYLDRMQKEFDDANREFDLINKSTETLIQKAKESELGDNVKAAGILAVVAVVLITALSGFASWINNQYSFSKTDGDRVIPGLGITAKEYERRQSCLMPGASC